MHRESVGSTTHALCPVGVDAILALLALGASSAGKEQLERYFAQRGAPLELLGKLKALRVDGLTCKSFAIFDADSNVNQNYVKQVESLATVERIGLQADPVASAAHVNELIKSACGFEDVLSPEMLAEACAVLLNLLNFKGEWMNTFQERNTLQRPFTKADGSIAQMPMMMQSEMMQVHVADAVNPLEIVRLHFSNDAYAEFVMNLESSAPLPSVTETEHMLEYRTCTLRLPRFKHQARIDLVPLVSKAGCPALFVSGNLCEMADHNVFVGLMFQVLACEFNEFGAEVQAATIAVCYPESAMAPRKPCSITFDRPFRFRIVAEGLEIVQGVYHGPDQ